MSTTELCPVDVPESGQAVLAPQQPGHPSSLTLYSLTEELAQLIALRTEMLESGEDTAAVDGEIAVYLQKLPEKVDAVAAVLHTLESQIALAKVEEDRIRARRKAFEGNRDRLKEYAAEVLGRMPAPKRGSRKLEGSSSTLVLKKNGGVPSLDIYDESLVPDEYCSYRGSLTAIEFRELLSAAEKGDARSEVLLKLVRFDREPENLVVRKALEDPCWLCQGNATDCTSCGGSGKAGVPGARLLERSYHLEIR